MADLINLLSRVKNLEGLGAGGSALVEEAISQVGKVLQSKDTLESELSTAKAARTTAEGERDEARSALEDAKKGQVSKADAERLEAYKALGTPEEIKQRQTDLETARVELRTTRRNTALREAGYDPVMLAAHLGDADAKLEPAKGDDGKETRVLRITTGEGDEAKTQTLEEWGKAKGFSDTQIKRFALETEETTHAANQVGKRDFDGDPKQVARREIDNLTK